jgi:tryptophan-rich sensory protein
MQTTNEAEPPLRRGGVRTKVARTRPGKGSLLGTALGLAAFAGASLLAAGVGARVTRRNKGWYRLLRKSDHNPPDKVFSLVWPVLYTLGVVSAWRVARAPASRERSRALALWGTQLACNAAWSPLFFGAHRPRAAMADLWANTASLAAYALEARKVDRPAAFLVLPNLGWLGFAATLNGSILARNAGARRVLFSD